jgi:glutamate/aspartate transport system permease protein
VWWSARDAPFIDIDSPERLMHLLLTRNADGSLYLTWILSGLMWTLTLWIVAGVTAYAIGITVGCMRTTPHQGLRLIGRAYVQVFRNVPLLVQAFLWYFVMPEVVPNSVGDWIKQIPPPWSSFIPAVLALSLFTASRIAEQVRAGVNTLPPGQLRASHALGLTTAQTYISILLPQALRITLPTLTTEALGLLKNTSVGLTIGLLELTAQAQQMNEFTFHTFEAFGTVTIVYLVIALAIHQVAYFIERRVRVPGFRTGH